MVRKLAMAVSLAVGSTLSLSAYALGLGEIRTSSALNENFKGEIELLSVEKGQLDTLKVGLAPAEVFARTGVERPYHLTHLKFKTLRKRDGRAVILVTSDVPIREPFLDFFVQVSWPTGKLVREYTVLLDPPVTTRRAAPVVQHAAARSAPSPASARRATRAPVVAPGGSYGPVRSNETLWGIAERVRPAGVSVHQMMVALYRANPAAFLNGNINLLKKGSVLRIPERDELRQIGRREAVTEFQRLSEGWIADTTAGAGAPAKGSAQAPEETARAPAEAPAEAGDGELRIAGVEETEATAEGGADVAAGTGEDEVARLKQKLLLVEEQAASARQESEALRERMAALEKQLEDMKRLLQLRNAELAQLQAQAADASAVVESAEPSEAAVGPASETSMDGEAAEETSGVGGQNGARTDLTEETVASVPEETLAETAAPEHGVSPVTETAEGETEMPDAAQTEVAPEVVSEGEEPQPAAARLPDESSAEQRTPPAKTETTESAPPAQAPAVTSSEPRSEQLLPFWRQWLQDNWQLAAGGSALVLALLGLMAVRRRKEAARQEPPPSAAAVQPAAESRQEKAEGDEVATAGAVADSAIGDTSFLSEYSTEELRALHEETSEVDPVSEADVYIAYGRYSQAEEILKEAMKSGNDNVEVRHKMLEVYYATQKKEEFRKLAEKMKAEGQDKENPRIWEHIQAMGRDLDRNNPLFAAATAAVGAAATAAALTDSQPEGEESDLSLDLSSLAEEVDSQLNADSEPMEGFSSMDLELPSLQIEPDTREEQTPEVARADDLELSSGGTELHTELADLSDLGDLDVGSNALDETLADLTGDLEGVMEDSRILDQPLDLQESVLSELENLSADALEKPAVQTPAAAPVESTATEGGEDSHIGDEVETKLELAKAFMEIGDADGARSILHEVQEDGTPQQKEAAAELLAQLDA